VDAAGNMVARQELRIRRGDRDPITVVQFPPSDPVPDRQGLCAGFGSRALPWGGGSVVVFPLQRLGVSPDGSGVVFEVNDDLLFSRFISLAPQQKGFFFVRSDGRGLRRLGPPSRDPTFRLGPDFISGSKDFRKVWVVAPPMFFSPDGRRVAFTDIGPGPGGEQAVQVFVLDLGTGERKQVTHLTPGPPAPVANASQFLLTCCPEFIDDKTIRFQTFVDPDGSNPQHDFTAFVVGIDGRGLRRNAVPPVALPGSYLVPSFAVTGSHTNLLRLNVPGIQPGTFPTTEIFLLDGKNLVQLTNFHRKDTFLGFLNPTRTRAFVLASADPLGKNPDGFCQMFSMNTRAGGLRQVTHLNSRVCSPRKGDGCFQVNGIGYGYLSDRLPGSGDRDGDLRLRLQSTRREQGRLSAVSHAPRRKRASSADRHLRNNGQPGRQHPGRAPRSVRLLGHAALKAELPLWGFLRPGSEAGGVYFFRATSVTMCSP
jgi:hypothetical protein